MIKGDSSKRMGLARALSKMGFCSRAKAFELIRQGKVRLNGEVCRDPERPVRLLRDRISVDDLPIKLADKLYWMMNKPRGVVTTASDEKGRETVYDVLAQSAPGFRLGEDSAKWLAPVGRLDKASEGMLLFTNDSEWGARVTDPKTHLEKIYHVQIAKVADERFVQSLIAGVRSEGDGELLRARKARLLRSGGKNCWLEIVLDEGKNRQIRRMMAALDVEVLRLVRVAIGPLQLGKLAKGECRPLTLDEKQSLDRAMRRRPTAIGRSARG